MSEFTRLSKMRFPARAYQLKEIRCVVNTAMQKIGCIQDDTDKIVIAINEACMNIIQHAYHDEPSGEIIVEIFHKQDELLFRITDFAQPVDVSKIKSRNLDELRPGGLGVHLMCEIMDEINYKQAPDGNGNMTEMRKKLQVSPN